MKLIILILTRIILTISLPHLPHCHSLQDCPQGLLGSYDSFNPVTSTGECHTRCASDPLCHFYSLITITNFLECSLGTSCQGNRRGCITSYTPSMGMSDVFWS